MVILSVFSTPNEGLKQAAETNKKTTNNVTYIILGGILPGALIYAGVKIHQRKKQEEEYI